MNIGRAFSAKFILVVFHFYHPRGGKNDSSLECSNTLGVQVCFTDYSQVYVAAVISY